MILKFAANHLPECVRYSLDQPRQILQNAERIAILPQHSHHADMLMPG
jgi:hypothetical protein